MPPVDSCCEELKASLLRSRNPDGGWPYHPGKASRLEPTCWAALALGGQDTATALQGWPAADGLLLERRGGSANYAFHGVAMLALHALGIEHAGGNDVLLDGLQRAKGDALPQSKINRQDNSLQGWSWIPGTFSWVEPTAWCLLALKRWARAPEKKVDVGRIHEAERLLTDRCSRTGGWNYGNSNMLGQELKSFVPTTAIALLAMQDKGALPEVQRSIDFLEREGIRERSGSALALALMALSACERPVSAVRNAMVDQVPTTLDFGNQMAIAMSLYSLSAPGKHAAFIL